MRKLTWMIVVASAITLTWPAFSVSSCSGPPWRALYNEVRGDPYVLDDFERTVEKRAEGTVVCPELELVTFEGHSAQFTPEVVVFPPFGERLKRFETAVTEVSRRFYRRAPARIVNAGGYLCRAVRHRPSRLSEHALGNAIDVVGFDFGPLNPAASDPAASDPPGELVEPLQAAFSVRVASDWNATTGPAAVHARFLRALVQTLDEKAIFRTILGPGHPTHGTHFHFDMAPYTYVRW